MTSPQVAVLDRLHTEYYYANTFVQSLSITAEAEPYTSPSVSISCAVDERESTHVLHV